MNSKIKARVLSKEISAFGGRQLLFCDGRCDKAWGIQARPREQLSDNVDDFVYLPDSKVGVAPPPGMTEIVSKGGDMKPTAEGIVDGRQMNKWCFRQCERSDTVELHEAKRPEVAPKDMERPRPNMSARQLDHV